MCVCSWCIRHHHIYLYRFSLYYLCNNIMHENWQRFHAESLIMLIIFDLYSYVVWLYIVDHIWNTYLFSCDLVLRLLYRFHLWWRGIRLDSIAREWIFFIYIYIFLLTAFSPILRLLCSAAAAAKEDIYIPRGMNELYVRAWLAVHWQHRDETARALILGSPVVFSYIIIIYVYRNLLDVLTWWWTNSFRVWWGRPSCRDIPPFIQSKCVVTS